jgi:hypothetical protein
LQEFFKASEQKLGESTPQGLSNIVYGLGNLPLEPGDLPESWLQEFFKASQQIMGEFSEQGLSNTILGLGNIQSKPDEKWMQVYLEAVRRKLAEFTIQGLSNFLYGLALLRFLPSEVLIKEILIKLDHERDEVHIEEMRQRYLFFQYIASRSGKSYHAHPFFSAWMVKMKDHSIKYDRTSKGEKAIEGVLSRIDPAFRPSQFIEEIGSIVDFYDPVSKRILQFDGPYHFLSRGSYNSSTLFQTELLESFGYTVLRLSYKSWDRDGEVALRKLLDKSSSK